MTPARSLIRGLATQVSPSTPYTPASVVHLPLTSWPASTSTSYAASSTVNHPDTPPNAHASTSALPLSSASTESTYVELPSHIFSSPSRPDILHQCVVAHLASLRQGTAATKGRSEVRGSGKKIMRQKGTGKARVGDRYSPIRRGGGHAFAKKPKDWSMGLNKKVWELGVRTALSERWRRGELSIIPSPPSLPSISTRSLISSFNSHPSASNWSSERTLFLVSSLDPSFTLSARNLANVEVRLVNDIDVYSTLRGKRVVLDVEAVQLLENRLGLRTALHATADTGANADADALAAMQKQEEEVVLDEELEEHEIKAWAEAEADFSGQDLSDPATMNALVAKYEEKLSLAEAQVEATDANAADASTSTSLAPSAPTPPANDEATNPDGGIKRNDVVIEQEEAPVKEKRHDAEDPRKDTATGEEAGKDKGDAIREHMEDLAQEKDKAAKSEDAPSPKDL